jgi:hypothetical protein
MTIPWRPPSTNTLVGLEESTYPVGESTCSHRGGQALDLGRRQTVRMRETVCWVAEELERIGWDVTVLTGVPNYPTGVVPDGYRADRASREEIDGIEVRRTPLYPSHDDNPMGRMLNYSSWALSSTYYGIGDIK